jgi:hypothetical protein
MVLPHSIKSKNINHCNHIDDFGMAAECHFFTTSHGRGACDDIRGRITMVTRKASLKIRCEDQIMTQTTLQLGCCKYPTFNFEYCMLKTTLK